MSRLRPARIFGLEAPPETGRGRPVKKKTCSVCGKAFKPSSGNQKTCSQECREALRRRTLAEYRERNIGRAPSGVPRSYSERVCERCGASYRPKSGNQKWCRGESCTRSS